VHADTTIAITRTDNNINIEVDSITGLQIVDRSIRREDLANSSVGGAIVQDRSIPITKLVAGGTPGQIIEINTAGTDAVWVDPPIAPIALGKYNGSNPLKSRGVSVSGNSGQYIVTFNPPRTSSDNDYIVHLDVFGDNGITLIDQNQNSFIVQITNNSALPTVVWFFTIFDF
jgi:hypothetical protein